MCTGTNIVKPKAFKIVTRKALKNSLSNSLLESQNLPGKYLILFFVVVEPFVSFRIFVFHERVITRPLYM